MAQSSTIVLEKNKTIIGKKYKVIMYNDPFTTFDCVIRILHEVFNKTESEGAAIAKAIHDSGPNGKKIIATYSTRSVADAKVAKSLRIAKEENCPTFRINVD